VRQVVLVRPIPASQVFGVGAIRALADRPAPRTENAPHSARDFAPHSADLYLATAAGISDTGVVAAPHRLKSSPRTMKLRVGEPWMPAKDYGRSLRGLTVNLLVAGIEAALAFQREVLGATIVYSDPDFAVCSGFEADWMLHADHTYENHPMGSTVGAASPRGGGLEIRLHGCDPDAAVAAPLC
jgi:hypothetical protein